MTLTKRIIQIWLILFIPFFGVKIINMYNSAKKAEQLRFINDYIGSKFSIDSFIDLNGNIAEIEPNKSEITIIDFWHKDCPPCIKEMKEFKDLLTDRENQVSIVSVSINNYNLWKQLFNSKNKTFSFLSDSIPNWKHLVLKSNKDPKLNNIIPSDNIQTLSKHYQTNSFPTYLVLDKTGAIIAAPTSAVEYLKIKVLRQNKYFAFIFNRQTWVGAYKWIPKVFVEYSGYFWIVLIFVNIFKRKSSAANNLGSITSTIRGTLL